MERPITFHSDGLSIGGEYSLPDRPLRGRIPGVVLAHGFAGARYPAFAAHLASLGYGVLAFDFRGYGKSGGERGTVLPGEQVSDVRNAVTWLSQQGEIDPQRICVVGSSLGGSIAIMATAADDRIKVCVAGCPLAYGDSPMRMVYDTEEKFAAFLTKVEQKKRAGGRIPRFDIVFIPENLRTFLPAGTPMEFSAYTVHGFLSLNPMEAITRIAPRPVFIIHAEDDRVAPVKDAKELKARGGGGCDLDVLPAGDHFIFGAKHVGEKIGAWLQKKMPPSQS